TDKRRQLLKDAEVLKCLLQGGWEGEDSLAILQHYLDRGGVYEVVVPEGKPPLLIQLHMQGRHAEVQLLVRAGASVSIPDRSGKTYIDYWKRDTPMFQELLQRGFVQLPKP